MSSTTAMTASQSCRGQEGPSIQSFDVQTPQPDRHKAPQSDSSTPDTTPESDRTSLQTGCTSPQTGRTTPQIQSIDQASQPIVVESVDDTTRYILSYLDLAW